MEELNAPGFLGAILSRPKKAFANSSVSLISNSLRVSVGFVMLSKVFSMNSTSESFPTEFKLAAACLILSNAVGPLQKLKGLEISRFSILISRVFVLANSSDLFGSSGASTFGVAVAISSANLSAGLISVIFSVIY